MKMKTKDRLWSVGSFLIPDLSQAQIAVMLSAGEKSADTGGGDSASA